MIYVTSDLHGYPIKKFMRLLKKVRFGDNDFLYVLGDVIDRGEDGIKILDWMMLQNNVQLILGNHEAMMLRCSFLLDTVTQQSVEQLSTEKMNCCYNWFSNGAEPTVNALRGKSLEAAQSIFDYLSEAPLYEALSVSGKDFLLTHSGLGSFDKNKKLTEYSERDFIWNRPSLQTRYFDDIITVFGHTPTAYFGAEYKGRILQTETWTDIDTGAAMGLSPTLFRLDDMKAFYCE